METSPNLLLGFPAQYLSVSFVVMTLKAYLDASGYLLLSQTVKVYPPWSQPLLIDDLSAVFYNEHQALGNE